MRTCLLGLAGIALVLAGTLSPALRASEEAKVERPRIQVALLLDTSNSMDGLLDQAKTQLWKVVNEFASAKRGGQRPEIQVALYEYGKQTLPSSSGFLRMILPLSTDLDKVSEELFALKTKGGEEYCGWAIKAATEELSWSASNKDLKAIFIAGNEPFNQGKVDYKTVCRAAIAKGIMINTIFCGGHDEGVSTLWQDGAQLADGAYMNIDQNRAVVHINAPQDGEIARLGGALNKTYIAYGDKGGGGLLRQAEQDRNAATAAPAAAAERAVAKSGAAYRADEWDLVDAMKEKKVDIANLKDEELPEDFKKLSAEERTVLVENKRKEREEIQATIQKLNEERKKYVAEEMKKSSEAGTNTLDGAMIKCVREQAMKKSFEFEGK